MNNVHTFTCQYYNTKYIFVNTTQKNNKAYQKIVKVSIKTLKMVYIKKNYLKIKGISYQEVNDDELGKFTGSNS